MRYFVLLDRDEEREVAGGNSDDEIQREDYLMSPRKGTKRDETDDARLMYLDLQGIMVWCYC